MKFRSAVLLLRDGKSFRGQALGSNKNAVGEVVFNTSMSGYQEILTDPSYAQQIITFTHPHIGNVGVNDQDKESSKVFTSGAVIRCPSLLGSNYRMQESFDQWLKNIDLTAIAGIDTRALVKHLRSEGSQDGAIVSYDNGQLDMAMNQGRELLAGFSGLKHIDLAQQVTCSKPYQWHQNSWSQVGGDTTSSEHRGFVVVYDFGVKQAILRLLADRGLKVLVVPATTSAEQVIEMQPDGVLLSNGPGDPQPCDYAISAIKKLIRAKIPIFGICLGFQLLALALGGRTVKMKFGHHGANHPVIDLLNGKIFISSQNHGFEVLTSSLDSQIIITHKSLFDNSLQGFVTSDRRAMGFQGHPEASPGPQDIATLFDRFTEMINAKT